MRVMILAGASSLLAHTWAELSHTLTKMLVDYEPHERNLASPACSHNNDSRGIA